MEYIELPIATALVRKLVDTGLYEEERAEELVKRVSDDDDKMISILGRLALEEQRGGSKVQQCIRALVKSKEIPQALDTFEKLAMHELADPTFPLE